MGSSSPSQRLPPLTFGEHRAKVSTDIRTFVDNMAKVLCGLNSYEPLDGAPNFASKSCAIDIGGLKLVAGANTPISVDVGSNDEVHLLVPFVGSCNSTIGRQRFMWHAGRQAMLLPKARRGGSSSTRSTLSIALDPSRLLTTVRHMAGVQDDSAIRLDIDDPRTLALDYFGRRLDEPLRQICRLIDACDLDGELLHRLGVDELVYRNVGLLIRPDVFLSGQSPSTADPRALRSDRAVDELCQYLRANLGARITATDMERVSGLSARALQYAFRKRFGCSPLEWLRAERLELGRQLIRTSDPELSITQLALVCGFGKVSEFSRHYRLRFGELPSRTRAGS